MVGTRPTIRSERVCGRRQRRRDETLRRIEMCVFGMNSLAILFFNNCDREGGEAEADEHVNRASGGEEIEVRAGLVVVRISDLASW